MLDQIEQKLSEEQLYSETIGHQSNYVVRLPVFEGPLDLLLHLIEKRQMEITTISLLSVTDQYLAYLQQWQEESIPLANMAAFISIATRLLYIKSQSLLPHTTPSLALPTPRKRNISPGHHRHLPRRPRIVETLPHHRSPKHSVQPHRPGTRRKLERGHKVIR